MFRISDTGSISSWIKVLDSWETLRRVVNLNRDELSFWNICKNSVENTFHFQFSIFVSQINCSSIFDLWIFTTFFGFIGVWPGGEQSVTELQSVLHSFHATTELHDKPIELSDTWKSLLSPCVSDWLMKNPLINVSPTHTSFCLHLTFSRLFSIHLSREKFVRGKYFGKENFHCESMSLRSQLRPKN